MHRMFKEVGLLSIGQTIERDECEINLDKKLIESSKRVALMRTIFNFNEGKKLIVNTNGLDVPDDLQELFKELDVEVRSDSQNRQNTF